MKLKNILFFILALVLSLIMAKHRWGDSSHAIGFISLSGGKVRHPAVMDSGREHYSQITTITVLPPFQGDANITLEGKPPVDFELFLAEPFIDLGFRQLPELRGNTIYNIKAGDRLALWTLIRPESQDSQTPDINRAEIRKFAGFFHHVFLRLENVIDIAYSSFSHKDMTKKSIQGRYELVFYNTASGKPVLSVPLIFKDAKDENGRKQH